MSYRQVIILISVMSLCISDVKPEEASPHQNSTETLEGLWYVGGVTPYSSDSKYPDMQCWTLYLYKTSPEVYKGVANYFIAPLSRNISEQFNATVIKTNTGSIDMNLFMLFGDEVKNLTVKVEPKKENCMLIQSAVRNVTLPFKYLLLGREPKSLKDFAESYSADTIVDNTKCKLNDPPNVGGDASSIHINSSLIVLFILFVSRNVNLMIH